MIYKLPQQSDSKWRTDPQRTRHTTYLSIAIDDFGYRPQIIVRGVGQRHFPVYPQKGSKLTLP